MRVGFCGLFSRFPSWEVFCPRVNYTFRNENQSFNGIRGGAPNCVIHVCRVLADTSAAATPKFALGESPSARTIIGPEVGSPFSGRLSLTASGTCPGDPPPRPFIRSNYTSLTSAAFPPPRAMATRLLRGTGGSNTTAVGPSGTAAAN